MKKKFTPILFIASLLLLIMILGNFAQAQTLGVSQHQVAAWDRRNYSLSSNFQGGLPSAGEKWEVTDGVAIFSFFMTPFNDIMFQSGYPFAPTPYNQPIQEFLNHTIVNVFGTAFGEFTLTQGVFLNPTCPTGQNTPPIHQCIGTVFVFDAVWISGPNQLTIIELNDPMLTNTNGLHYFIPDNVKNQTAGMFSVQTDGIPNELSAINLPNGDVLIGDNELVGGQQQATIYKFAASYPAYPSSCSSQAGNGPVQCPALFYKIASFSQTVQYVGFSAQVEYVAPFVYYVVGTNWQSSTVNVQPLVIYQASEASGWVPNGTQVVTGNTLSTEEFTVSADPTHLYIGGYMNASYSGAGHNDTLFVETITPSLLGTNSNNTLYTIDTITVLNALQPWKKIGSGIFTENIAGIFMSTHLYGTGVHFYYTYTYAPYNQTMIGVSYNHDGGHVWDVVNQWPLAEPFNSFIPPFMTGAGRTFSSYNPEIDYILLVGIGGSGGSPITDFNRYMVESALMTLPSVIKVTTGNTSTLWHVEYNTENTVTVTANSGFIVPDIATPAIMLIIVAFPAGVFGIGGSYMGGGRIGIILMLLGTAVGIFAGVIWNLYPFWTLLIMLLSIVTAILYVRGPTGGTEAIPT